MDLLKKRKKSPEPLLNIPVKRDFTIIGARHHQKLDDPGTYLFWFNFLIMGIVKE